MKNRVRISLLTLTVLLLNLTGCTAFHKHEWLEATCTKPMICSICGQESGEPLGHKPTEPTCVKAGICEVCGAVIINPTGHSMMEATCTEPRKCSVCGAIEGQPLGHDFTGGNCTEKSKCTRCGEEGGLGSHNFESGYCTICGEIALDIISYNGYIIEELGAVNTAIGDIVDYVITMLYIDYDCCMNDIYPSLIYTYGSDVTDCLIDIATAVSEYGNASDKNDEVYSYMLGIYDAVTELSDVVNGWSVSDKVIDYVNALYDGIDAYSKEVDKYYNYLNKIYSEAGYADAAPL